MKPNKQFRKFVFTLDVHILIVKVQLKFNRNSKRMDNAFYESVSFEW